MFPSKVVNLTCANLQYRVCCPVAQREGSIKCIKIGVVIAKVTAGLKGTQLNFCILNVHLCIWQMLLSIVAFKVHIAFREYILLLLALH